ncbi:MAG: Glutathione S-transferase domain [Alphaproteobacteria bacterium]|nr:Glutathione S-transferase domain [Alphaproteobacteria bacterium]
MTDLPRLTTFGWVPDFARGLVRDVRVRWAFEEVGQPYEVDLIRDAKSDAHRANQPFGQVPCYSDGEVEMFESGAIVLRIAERAGKLIPSDLRGRMNTVQWVIAALNSVEPPVLGLIINDRFEGDRPWADERRPVARAYLETRLRDLAARLGDKKWLEGDAFTVGDLMMVSVLRPLRLISVLDEFPTLAAYVARGEARPAFQKALADHLAVFEQPIAA